MKILILDNQLRGEGALLPSRSFLDHDAACKKDQWSIDRKNEKRIATYNQKLFLNASMRLLDFSKAPRINSEMNSVKSSQTVLVVDDSDDDYDATVRALIKDTNLKNPIKRCKDGRDALDYLFRRERYAEADSAPRPAIILLDLNMPGIDGRKVLKAIKSDSDLRSIPTVVMTNSDDERDINDCYDMGANTYVQKPLNLTRFFAAMARLKEYWFEIAVLPKL